MAHFCVATENYWFFEVLPKAVYTLVCLCAIIWKIQPYIKGKNREWGKTSGPSLHTQALGHRELHSALSVKMLGRSTCHHLLWITCSPHAWNLGQHSLASESLSHRRLSLFWDHIHSPWRRGQPFRQALSGLRRTAESLLLEESTKLRTSRPACMW